VQSPGAYQYVDARAGLSYSFDFKQNPNSKPNPTPSATPKASSSPSPVVSATPVATVAETQPPPATASIELHEAPPITGLSKKAALSLMKTTYRKGTAAMKAHQYKTAVKHFKKAVSIKEKHVPAYFYAEAYADLGIIYQFHLKTAKDNKKIALEYYRRSLKYDPMTENARKYYPKLKAELAKSKPAKKARKVHEAPASEEKPADEPTPVPEKAPAKPEAKVKTVATPSSDMSIDLGSGGSAK